MTEARAIFQATFVKVIQVQGRKVFQFVFEVPTEAAGHALRALGGPEATINETWVAIARLDTKAVQRAPGEPKQEKKGSLTRQAALACDDPRFRAWLNETHGLTTIDSAEVAHAVRSICAVASRAEFDSDPEAGKRWQMLYTEFQAEDHGA